MDRISLIAKHSVYPESYDFEQLIKQTNTLREQNHHLVQKNFMGSNVTPKLYNNNNNNRSHSPELSDTLNRHLFIKKVITQQQQQLPQEQHQQQQTVVHNGGNKSLEEISKDIKKFEDFLSVSEEILRKERERDRELYARERRRRTNERQDSKKRCTKNVSGKNVLSENSSGEISPKISPKSIKSSKASSPTYKILSPKNKHKSYKMKSPKSRRMSKLYFKDGKIGCMDAEMASKLNIESTHELVKDIISKENINPLVSSENVKRVLEDYTDLELSDMEDEFHDTSAIIGTFLPRKSIDVDQFPCVEETILQVADISSLVGTPIEEDSFKFTQVGFGNSNKEARRMSCFEARIPTPDREIQRRKSIQHGEIIVQEEEQQFVRDRVRHLINRFTERAKKMQHRLEMPPTPSSSASSSSPPPVPPNKQILHNETRKVSSDNTNTSNIFESDSQSSSKCYWICPTFCGGGRKDDVLDPQGKVYIAWLFIVSLSFLYNAWVIPLRSSFPFQTKENTQLWLILDFCADIIYILDVLFFKHRIMYLFEGFWVKDKNLTRKNYMRKLQFKMDIISLIPLDLFYLKLGTSAVFLRAPRLLKIQSFWEFFKLLDRVIASPHMLRVAKTLAYMLYMIHLTACSYYAYSSYQGLGTNRWVFSGKGHPYVRCFAFATKTATSIGKNPKPENDGELLFMTAAWLMGVFVFALLIGQIRDIIATATRSQSEYKQLVDETLEYMRQVNLPTDLQRRVQMWYTFTWAQQRTLDESQVLDTLPANLKTDIAISVHIQTLSKVQLFADCEDALLRELVLKLRSITFLPGDYVCRKGEVGKEMYIIKLGQVHVMGGIKNDEVLATLSEGSVFGEISLLAINSADGNRRTADVKSKGYSNLFVLSKSDLNEAIVNYPNAQGVLKRRARSLMRKNAARERAEATKARCSSPEQADVVIGNPTRAQSPPRLLQTVIQALPTASPAIMLLTQGSRRGRKKPDGETTTTNDDEIITTTELPGSATTEKPENNNETIKPSTFKLENEKTKQIDSELLISIQNELKMKNTLINLTDNEKSLILRENINGTSAGDEQLFIKSECNSIEDPEIKCDVTVHREM